MTLTSDDIERLKKLLALTASDHDGEALAAIRKANSILKRHRVHWYDLFADGSLAAGASELAERHARRQIKAAFDYLIPRTSGSFRLFVEDVQQQWLITKRLSVKQRNVIFDAVDRLRKREA